MEPLSYTTRRHTKYLDIEFNRGVKDGVKCALNDLGFVYLSHIRSWRGSRNHEQAIAVADRAVANSKKSMAIRSKGGATLCWDCTNSGHGNTSICPWEREFKPVDGWDAEMSMKEITYDKFRRSVETYFVKACPLFEQQPSRKCAKEGRKFV